MTFVVCADGPDGPLGRIGVQDLARALRMTGELMADLGATSVSVMETTATASVVVARASVGI